MELQERLSYYETDVNGCHNWLRGTQRGYAAVYDGKKTVSAHRLAYWLAFGDIPPGYDVHHLCENKRCINPEHLMLASRSDHIRAHLAHRKCKRGHSLDNAYVDPTGARRCRVCKVEGGRLYRERMKK